MLVTEYLPRGDLWRALSKDSQHVFSWYRRRGPAHAGRRAPAACLRVSRALLLLCSKVLEWLVDSTQQVIFPFLADQASLA